jgi:predicted permease
MDGTFQDIRFALRTARLNPAFVLAAVCTLALAIGANAAIFSIVSGVLLRPLPYAQPEDLVVLRSVAERIGPGVVFYQDMVEWRGQSHNFTGMTAYGGGSKNLTDVADPERLATGWGERQLFQVLGVTAMLGRTFRADDPPDVVVLSARLWKRRFSSDAAWVGRRIALDGVPHTIIGVMPPSFQFPYRSSLTELWIPWTMEPGANRNRRVDGAIARVRHGVSLAAASRELDELTKRQAERYPENRGRSARITPLSEIVAGGARPALLALLGAVGVVLLIACANVSNLLLSRAARRTHEIAVRAALGATRGRLLRQLLTESLLLSLAGGLAGLAVAAAGMRLILNLAAEQIPRSNDIALDWRVFAFLIAVSAATGIAFGILPGMAAARVNPHDSMKQSGRSGPAAGGRWLRDGLVIAEVALSFVLLVTGGLLLQSFLRLVETPTGLAPDHVLTMRLSVALRDYATPGRYGQYLATLEERLRQVPGVRNAGFIQYLPLQNYGWNAFFTIRGRPEEGSSELRYVSPGYFQAMGIPLRRGRLLNEHDTPGQTPVILVNDALARRYFPGEDPVGRQTNRGTIVGVVGDVRTSRLDQPASPEIYYPFAQNPAATSGAGVALVVRTAVDPESTAGSVRAAIQDVNPQQVLFGVKTMERVIGDSVSDRKLYVWLIAVFAGMALVLVVSGVYAVVSLAVAARTREFGIRVALGASGTQVARLVLGHGGMLVGAGLALGALGTMGTIRAVAALGGTAGADPATLSAAGAVLGVVALAACAAPARRAVRVDVTAALKED